MFLFLYSVVQCKPGSTSFRLQKRKARKAKKKEDKSNPNNVQSVVLSAIWTALTWITLELRRAAVGSFLIVLNERSLGSGRKDATL